MGLMLVVNKRKNANVMLTSELNCKQETHNILYDLILVREVDPPLFVLLGIYFSLSVFIGQ